MKGKFISQEEQAKIVLSNINEAIKTQVQGDSGTERYSGYFTQEKNHEWRDDARIENVNKMRKSDGFVKMMLNGIKSPLLAIDWFVDSEDEKIKEFCEKCLFNMEKRTWKEALREFTTYLEFGFSVFEKIYKKFDDGKIGISDLAPRIQESIESWQISMDGGYTRGIRQRLQTDEVDDLIREIPITKCLVFTHEKEGDDLTGEPLLRSCWKAFSMKDVLLRIMVMSAERFGMGVVVIYGPEAGGENDKSKGEEIGESLRGNEKAFVYFPGGKKPEGWNLEIITPNGNPLGSQMIETLNELNREMASSVLMGFMMIGGGMGSGSQSLAETLKDFFFNFAENISMYISEQIERQVLIPLIDLNFGKQEKYPKLNHSPVEDIKAKEFADMIATLVDSGMIFPDKKTKAFVRSNVGLNELSEEELDEEEEKTIEKSINQISTIE